jgi:hypothetical protein
VEVTTAKLDLPGNVLPELHNLITNQGKAAAALEDQL